MTGHLVNSITHEVNGMEGRVGSNLRYARIHELGGTVSASSGALAVPVHPDARKSGGPRNMSDLTMVKRPGKPPLLIRERTIGKIGGGRRMTDVMFVLLKSVRIPARPYLRPALAATQERVRAILARGIGK
jgi:phage gpG-like protein